jgi:hypothetical protein
MIASSASRLGLRVPLAKLELAVNNLFRGIV